jgi:hypothetical protein
MITPPTLGSKRNWLHHSTKLIRYHTSTSHQPTITDQPTPIGRHALTREGHEMQFATNSFGHFALTAGLRAALAEAGGARMVSLAHLACNVDAVLAREAGAVLGVPCGRMGPGNVERLWDLAAGFVVG